MTDDDFVRAVHHELRDVEEAIAIEAVAMLRRLVEWIRANPEAVRPLNDDDRKTAERITRLANELEELVWEVSDRDGDRALATWIEAYMPAGEMFDDWLPLHEQLGFLDQLIQATKRVNAEHKREAKRPVEDESFVVCQVIQALDGCVGGDVGRNIARLTMHACGMRVTKAQVCDYWNYWAAKA